MKKIFTKSLLVVFLFLAFLRANAQDGTIDSTFGVNGIFRYAIGADNNQRLAVLPDGRFYFYGDVNPYTKLRAIRCKADGSIDSSFGLNGIATIDYSGLLSRIQIRALDVQPDGKLVIAGVARNFFTPPIVNDKNLLVRFDTNGVADINRQFGFREICYPTSVKCTDDGKILVMGSSYYSSDWQPPQPLGNYAYVAKFDANGNEDNSFGTSGSFEMFGNPSCYNCVANQVAFQSSGNIITYLSAGRFIRLSPVGNMDFSFGNNGFANASTYDVVIQPDGKIISGAFFSSLTRYTADGLVDSTFGVNGIASLGLTAYAPCNSLALQTDGKILAAGSLYSSTSQYKPMCCRFNSNGTLDSTFGTNGIFVYTGFTASRQFYKVVPYADKILLGATSSYDTANYIRLNNPGFILPVHLLNFTAQLKTTSPISYGEGRDEVALLNWQVANEQNFSRYQVERSPNGKEFNPIGTVNAANKKEYSFVDNKPFTYSAIQQKEEDKAYYRLKMIDIDGRFTYSPIRSIAKNIQQNTLNIYPNPGKDFITFNTNGITSYRLINASGKVVCTKKLNGIVVEKLAVNGYAKGVYLLQAYFANGSVQSGKVVVE